MKKTMNHILEGIETKLAGAGAAGLVDEDLARLRDMIAEIERCEFYSAILGEINAGLKPDEILDNIYDSFHKYIPYDRIGCALLDEAGTTVTSRWNRASYGVTFVDAGFSARLAGSSLEKIIRTGSPRVLNDLAEYLREHPNSISTSLIVREGIMSSLTCPLTAMNRPIGFLFFSSLKKNTYRDEHVEVYMKITAEVSIIIEKSRLLEKNMELNELKNRFIGMAAHDLRNPLFVISGYLSLIKRGKFGEVSEPLAKTVDNLIRVSSGMLTIVDDILDINMIESGELKLELARAPLNELVEEKCAEYEFMAQNKSIRIERELDARAPEVEIDRKRMGQVMENLLSNAVKFSHPDSVIRVKTSVKDGKVRTSVFNKGEPIPEKERGAIFKNFGRTSVKATGGEKSTGLGLAIVKKIVESHGGMVGFITGAGEQTEFYFVLPTQRKKES